MKQTQSINLHLRQQQSLQMTPQLQQAIKLLTLSAQELVDEIQKQVDENPLLETADEDFDNNVDTPTANQQQELLETGEPTPGLDDPDYGTGASDDVDSYADATTGGGDGAEFTSGDTAGEYDAIEYGEDGVPAVDNGAGDSDLPMEGQWQEDVPEQLPVDSSWEDIYSSNGSGLASPGLNDDRDFERAPDEQNLQDHLLWQLNLARLSTKDVLIGQAIIDAIDEGGFLSVPLSDVYAGLDPALGIEVDEVETILHLIQQFEPVGVAARDLRECLLLQLRQLSAIEHHAEATHMVCNHLDLLASRNFVLLGRRMHLDDATLRKVIAVVRGLTPRPGSKFNSTKTEYITPDVIVSRERGRWVVELNPEVAPRLRITPEYAALIPRGRSKPADAQTGHYLRDKLQEARWFINGLRHRSATLLKVAGKIVELQRGFFEHGPERLKPLVLRDVAEAIGVHESTISRVTTRKYMHTPRGVYELKYFFAAQLTTTSGESVANKVIQAHIKKLCIAEDPRKPLSDAQIVAQLVEDGYRVARRTVAKYRDALGIPSSNERRRAM